MSETIYGRNAVRECLRAKKRRLHKLLILKGTKPSPIINEILSLAHSQNIAVQQVSKEQFKEIGRGHQGVALQAGRLPTLQIDDILAHAAKLNEAPFIVALDHLEDPHNVGAILRTAEAVGAHGIILPERRSAGITAAVVNASAGASEHLNIVIVSNLAQTLNKLKKENIWVVGIEDHPQAQPYHKVDLNMALALVLGNEGKGMTRLISETCDLLISLPMRGHVDSLNASVAGALGLYEAWRARQFTA